MHTTAMAEAMKMATMAMHQRKQAQGTALGLAEGKERGRVRSCSCPWWIRRIPHLQKATVGLQKAGDGMNGRLLRQARVQRVRRTEEAGKMKPGRASKSGRMQVQHRTPETMPVQLPGKTAHGNIQGGRGCITGQAVCGQ